MPSKFRRLSIKTTVAPCANEDLRDVASVSESSSTGPSSESSSVSEPSPCCSAPPSSEELRGAVSLLLNGRDLAALSLRTLRNELERHLGVDEGSLETRKEELVDIVQEYIQQVSSAEEAEAAAADTAAAEAKLARRAQRKELRRNKKVLRARMAKRKVGKTVQRKRPRVKGRKLRKSHRKPSESGAPTSIYQIFRKETYALVKGDSQTASAEVAASEQTKCMSPLDIMRIVNERWRALTDEDKSQLEEKLKIAKETAATESAAKETAATPAPTVQKPAKVPQSAYIAFYMEQHSGIRSELLASHPEGFSPGVGLIAKIVQERWRAMSEEEKSSLSEKHKIAKENAAAAKMSSKSSEGASAKRKVATAKIVSSKNAAEASAKRDLATEAAIPAAGYGLAESGSDACVQRGDAPVNSNDVAASSVGMPTALTDEVVDTDPQPMTRSEFTNLKQRLQLTLAAPASRTDGGNSAASLSVNQIDMEAKVFKSGSTGWSHWNSFEMVLGGQQLTVKATLNFFVEGSKNWVDGSSLESAATTPHEQNVGTYTSRALSEELSEKMPTAPVTPEPCQFSKSVDAEMEMGSAVKTFAPTDAVSSQACCEPMACETAEMTDDGKLGETSATQDPNFVHAPSELPELAMDTTPPADGTIAFAGGSP